MNKNGGLLEIALRKCSQCKLDKPLTEYYKYTTGKPHGQCKSCIRKHQQDKRNLNRIDYNKSNQKRHTESKARAIEYKGGFCNDCGGTFHQSVYDFHHIDPNEKDSSWSLHRSWEYLKKELDKCILLCANCHRIRHWKEN